MTHDRIHAGVVLEDPGHLAPLVAALPCGEVDLVEQQVRQANVAASSEFAPDTKEHQPPGLELPHLQAPDGPQSAQGVEETAAIADGFIEVRQRKDHAGGLAVDGGDDSEAL